MADFLLILFELYFKCIYENDPLPHKTCDTWCVIVVHLPSCLIGSKHLRPFSHCQNASSVPPSLFALLCVIHTSTGQRFLSGCAEQISSATSEPENCPKLACSGLVSWILWQACLIVSTLMKAHEAVWAWTSPEICGRHGGGAALAFGLLLSAQNMETMSFKPVC